MKEHEKDWVEINDVTGIRDIAKMLAEAMGLVLNGADADAVDHEAHALRCSVCVVRALEYQMMLYALDEMLGRLDGHNSGEAALALAEALQKVFKNITGIDSTVVPDPFEDGKVWMDPRK